MSDAKTMERLSALEAWCAKLEDRLNILSGKDPVTSAPAKLPTPYQAPVTDPCSMLRAKGLLIMRNTDDADTIRALVAEHGHDAVKTAAENLLKSRGGKAYVSDLCRAMAETVRVEAPAPDPKPIRIDPAATVRAIIDAHRAGSIPERMLKGVNSGYVKELAKVDSAKEREVILGWLLESNPDYLRYVVEKQ